MAHSTFSLGLAHPPGVGALRRTRLQQREGRKHPLPSPRVQRAGSPGGEIQRPKLQPLGWRHHLEIDHSGLYTLELPQPAVLTLTVLNPANGQPVPDAEVTWYTAVAGPSLGASQFPADPLDRPGQYRLVAPAGRVDLDVESETPGYARRSVDLVSGEQALDFSLTAVAGCGLSPMDGSQNVTPQPVDFAFRLTGIGFEAEPTWTPTWHDKESIRQLLPAGRYELKLPQLAGYLPVPSREIKPVAGKFHPVVIELESQP